MHTLKHRTCHVTIALLETGTVSIKLRRDTILRLDSLDPKSNTSTTLMLNALLGGIHKLCHTLRGAEGGDEV